MFTCVALAALCLVCAGGAPDGYRLVWSDDFNRAGRPDPAKWTYETGFVRNEEAQWYQADNARCEGGRLIIEARRERKPNPGYQPGAADWRAKREFAEYTYASLKTAGLHSWTYGRFETRARIDTRAGLWPAFWTVGDQGEWPAGGEIDIMEYYRGMLLANVAWGTDRRWVAKWDAASKPIAQFKDKRWSDRFHVWRMDWTPEAIRLFVDGELLNETLLTTTLNPDGSNPFTRPHHIILNLAIGGANGGDPASTTFPARFEVDYVRVYQKPG